MKQEKNGSFEQQTGLINTIVGQSNNIVVLFNPETDKVDFATKSAEKAIGVSDKEICENLSNLIACCPDRELEGKVRKWYKDGHQGDLTFETVFYNKKQGVNRVYQVEIRHIQINDQDMVIGVLFDRTRDNSRNRKMHDILNMTTNEFASQRNFIAQMSHKFRTSMNVITGYLILMSKSADEPDKVREYTHQMSSACADLMGVLNRIVDVNAREHGNGTLSMEEFSVDDLLKQVTEEFSVRADSKYQTIEYDTSGLVHRKFIGDRKRIGEILHSLLSNAVRYTPENGRLQLSVSDAEGPENEPRDLIFSVTDNGIGMDEKMLEKVFDPFAEERKEDPGSTKSMGYGLVIAKKLTEMMGGTIDIESHKNEGTRLTVRIPLLTTEKTPDTFWKEHGIHRVLIATSDVAEAARIQSLLRSAGLDTVCTTSGYGAIQMIEQAYRENNNFDIFLIDTEVQEMESLSIARSLQSMAWIDVPTVLLMSNDANALKNKEGLGIAGVMPKPFYIAGLRGLIEDMGIYGEKSRHFSDADSLEENLLAGMRFLVAEDNTLNADIIKGILEMEGAHCEIAGNGKAAVMMFSNSKPGYYDMILMDVQMPVMDGYEATSAIRSLNRKDASEIPILAMTANSFAKDIQKSFDSGMDAYLAKPIDARILNSTIRGVLRSEGVLDA